MTKLQIISKLWSVIYDMQLATKPREEIGEELDILEYDAENTQTQTIWRKCHERIKTSKANNILV